MDYEKILKEQLRNVADIDQLDEISNNSAALSKGLSEGFSLDEIVNATLSGESIFNSSELITGIKALVLYEVNNALIVGVEILTICICIGLLNNLSASLGKKSISELSRLVCTMVIMGIATKSFDIAYEMCIDSVNAMVSTMEIMTPVMIGILISTGKLASGTILSPVIIGAVTGTGILMKRIVLPAMFAGAMLSMINCLTEKNYVNKLAKLVRNGALCVSGLVVTVLSGIITVQGLLTETSDGLLMNTAKYSLNTFIPIVGGFTADTVELFLKCMGSIRSIVGVFGIIALIMMIVVPLIKMIVVALIYKITAAAAEPIAETKISDGLNDVGSCLISMASIMFFTALLFIIFLSVIARTGNGG